MELLNNKRYDNISINTSLGQTQVWGLNSKREDLATLVIFPGARTTPLFWDLDNGLNNIGKSLRIYMIETNGLPNNSDGNTPDIKSDGYGHWANEIFEQLRIEKAFVAGASFGGLIAMKLAKVQPQKISAAFLLNPGCLQPFSMKMSNLYYNLLPIIKPTEKNVRKFLDKAVFCKPNHQLSKEAEQMLVDYELLALTRYIDKTQKPYYMNDELNHANVATYLLEGDKDLLFPSEKSITNARKHLPDLRDVVVYPNVGHGIEIYSKALQYIGNTISSLHS